LFFCYIGLAWYAFQILRKLLRAILQTAHGDRLASLAMPAFGTGILKIPHDLVARVMYEEVAAFSAAEPRSTLRDIRFVLFDRDVKSIQVSSCFLIGTLRVSR